MTVEMWDVIKEKYYEEFDNYMWVTDLYGNPDLDVERFIKGRNL